ncbi:MAG: sulfite exporter TauE/SafE family protein [Dehalococcoidales bacterium]
MAFQIILAAVSIIAGAVASVAGFGIGSLLTPLLTIETGISTAVAGVSIAHFFGTSLRFLLLRKSLNRRILLSFGLASAAGGLTGALLHNAFQNIVLTIIFGCLLVLAGILGLTALSEKIRFKGIMAWITGGVSGLFGGLVGNQGGIRSAALLGFGLEKDEFVATATGIALMVDIARMPVYLAFQWDQITSIWTYILIATAGVIIGTLGGKRILKKIPEHIFKKIVSAIILLIGIWILIQR